jgi:hypothetical protein
VRPLSADHVGALPSHITVPIAASADNTLRALLTSLSAVAVAIIAAQVALFNFLFGQLLGKYTSGVVQTVIQHRPLGPESSLSRKEERPLEAFERIRATLLARVTLNRLATCAALIFP